jgi:hypothetical protein
MNEEQIRQIVREEMVRNYRSGAPLIPPHTHNGNDNLRIPQSNIVSSVKGNAFIESIVSETFTLSVTASPTSVIFVGYAANNASGGSANKRAIINGNAQLGASYLFTGSGSTFSPGARQSLVQVSNAMYVDSGSLGNNRVTTSDAAIALVQDSSGTTIVSVTIVSFDSKSVTFQTTLASGWEITGNYLVI